MGTSISITKLFLCTHLPCGCVGQWRAGIPSEVRFYTFRIADTCTIRHGHDDTRAQVVEDLGARSWEDALAVCASWFERARMAEMPIPEQLAHIEAILSRPGIVQWQMNFDQLDFLLDAVEAMRDSFHPRSGHWKRLDSLHTDVYGRDWARAREAIRDIRHALEDLLAEHVLFADQADDSWPPAEKAHHLAAGREQRRQLGITRFYLFPGHLFQDRRSRIPEMIGVSR